MKSSKVLKSIYWLLFTGKYKVVSYLVLFTNVRTFPQFSDSPLFIIIIVVQGFVFIKRKHFLLQALKKKRNNQRGAFLDFLWVFFAAHSKHMALMYKGHHLHFCIVWQCWAFYLYLYPQCSSLRITPTINFCWKGVVYFSNDRGSIFF